MTVPAYRTDPPHDLSPPVGVTPAMLALVEAQDRCDLIRLVLGMERRGAISRAATDELLAGIAQQDAALVEMVGRFMVASEAVPSAN